MTTSHPDSAASARRRKASQASRDLQRSSSRSNTRKTPSSALRARLLSKTQPVFLLLLSLRIVNALTLRTLYVPDEYYQSLEPAWQLAFGPHAGAWITWEWRHQLRSSLHPLLFAASYRAAALASSAFGLPPETHSSVLLVAPKLVQAFFAAGLDYSTWQLARRIFGPQSHVAWTTLSLSILSPWQWFCSTRTLSNSLEASLTAAALYHWPWHWLLPTSEHGLRSPIHSQKKERATRPADITTGEGNSSLRISLCLAAIASILRPTNVLVWVPIAWQTLWRSSNSRRGTLIASAIICGSAVAGLTGLADWWFYGFPTFPPLHFLVFNVHQDLAVFYGVHRWDYYLTEGLPLVLLGCLPFAVVGLFRSASMSANGRSSRSYSPELAVLPTFAWTVTFVVFSMSLIRHKEARFIYPLLPCLHILAGKEVSFFLRKLTIWKGFIILTILCLQLVMIIFTAQRHQRGVIDVLGYLREQQLARSYDSNSTVGFLMPCHSTPWRSHLLDPTIDAWALTCEPPVNVPKAERPAYLDEADQFYADPDLWLSQHMESVDALRDISIAEQSRKSAKHTDRTSNGQVSGSNRPWPQYLVFFQQLESHMHGFLGNSPYKECWRTFNSDWHDDSRRRGDVVVWCLDNS